MGLGWFREGRREPSGVCREVREGPNGKVGRTHASSCTEQGSDCSSPPSAGRPATHTAPLPSVKQGRRRTPEDGWEGEGDSICKVGA